jgi:hypothetical protein
MGSQEPFAEAGLQQPPISSQEATITNWSHKACTPSFFHGHLVFSNKTVSCGGGVGFPSLFESWVCSPALKKTKTKTKTNLKKSTSLVKR